MDNHGLRYYDPQVGRYLTRDPIGYGDGMNVYLYVHDNPINHIDPLGLLTAGGFVRGAWNAIKEPFAEVHDIWLSLYVGVNNAFSDAKIHSEDVSLQSGLGNMQAARRVEGQSYGETVAKGSAESLANVGTLGAWGACRNIVQSSIEYTQGKITADELDERLSQGAGGAVAVAAAGGLSSKLAGTGWTGRGGAGARAPGVESPPPGLQIPQFVKDGGSFVQWARNLQKSGQSLTKDQADWLSREAMRYNVDIRADAPHGGNNPHQYWHLNVGKVGQGHVSTPEGYNQDAMNSAQSGVGNVSGGSVGLAAGAAAGNAPRGSTANEKQDD